MSKPDGLDYSYGRPSPATLKAAGIKLVGRYLSHDSTKNLTGPEASALHAAGIGILLNWESVQGRPLGGAATGQPDGHDAAELAESIGAPHGLTIYYSCDTDTTPGQWPMIADYYAAAGKATAGRYAVGVYGEADLIDYLHRHGVVTSEWQTYAWSNGRLSANADLFQYLNNQTVDGAAVDFDRIIHPDQLGAWWPSGSEFDMPTADEIAAAVWNRKLSDGDREQPAAAWLKQSRNLSDPKVVLDHLDKELAKLNLDPPTLAAVKLAAQQGVQAAFAKAAS
jgi:hypothetical protein